MQFKKSIIPLLALLSASSFANAQNVYIEDGLSLVKVGADSRQEDPISNISSITFPASLITIGQAVNYSLLPTGYDLEDRTKFDPETRTVLMRKIPRTQRKFEYTTIEQVIQALVGNSFAINKDKVSRTISIEYKSN
ncbi:hypothetical protein [Vibrio gangliei]|uniref:hypothetical protein n=1 Tax=Vibrio gangliei TaxID=2077090 RepID=UPI000D01567F|nr:hypothetical protein [Vibrio gangliei]